MTGSFRWNLVLGVLGALLLAWLALVLMLVIVRPRGGLLREALRVLPDVLRLVRRLAADRSLPRGNGEGILGNTAQRSCWSAIRMLRSD